MQTDGGLWSGVCSVFPHLSAGRPSLMTTDAAFQRLMDGARRCGEAAAALLQQQKGKLPRRCPEAPIWISRAQEMFKNLSASVGFVYKRLFTLEMFFFVETSEFSISRAPDLQLFLFSSPAKKSIKE